MEERLKALAIWLLGPETALGSLRRALRGAIAEPSEAPATHLWPRWLFLRALGFIYFSAFYSLAFQIKGLIGPDGILPAGDYLQAVGAAFHARRFWFAPTLLWLGSSDHALMLLVWVGLIASVLLFLNVWPRATLAICFVCFLSFVVAAQDFSGYQSDGMLLEAGFLSLFFAPPGTWPGLGRRHAPSRASLFLLQWEWFRIYFQSGAGKLLSHDLSWRNLTAMDDYYQNCPLPTWIGWYTQHLPHWFHAGTVIFTFAAELVLVWTLFLPRRFRIACFCIVTPFQIGIILTGNYAFLNYIVLALGFLLLDDRVVEWLLPARTLRPFRSRAAGSPSESEAQRSAGRRSAEGTFARWRRVLSPVRMIAAGVILGALFFVSASQVLGMFTPSPPPGQTLAEDVAPLRISNSYGLFERMTHVRYEIEFQGSYDGRTWRVYPFRYKPQDPNAAPGIYSPYQPRFEWNLWFASLGRWQQYHFVVWTEERLLGNNPDVIELFAANPFGSQPPKIVRTVIYQYWFTTLAEKRATGAWWRRELLGVYCPPLGREPDGRIGVLDLPLANPPLP